MRAIGTHREVYPPAMIAATRAALAFSLIIVHTVLAAQQAPATRRSERLHMPAVEVRSPNGQVTLTLLPNAERLTFTVALGASTVLEPSPIVLTLDGYDLSSGVVLGDVLKDEVK